MGKTILTISETEYTVDNFTYSLNRPRGCPPGEVNYLSVSLFDNVAARVKTDTE
jgi:hypothetical protein